MGRSFTKNQTDILKITHFRTIPIHLLYHVKRVSIPDKVCNKTQLIASYLSEASGGLPSKLLLLLSNSMQMSLMFYVCFTRAVTPKLLGHIIATIQQ